MAFIAISIICGFILAALLNTECALPRWWWFPAFGSAPPAWGLCCCCCCCQQESKRQMRQPNDTNKTPNSETFAAATERSDVVTYVTAVASLSVLLAVFLRLWRRTRRCCYSDLPAVAEKQLASIIASSLAASLTDPATVRPCIAPVCKDGAGQRPRADCKQPGSAAGHGCSCGGGPGCDQDPGKHLPWQQAPHLRGHPLCWRVDEVCWGECTASAQRQASQPPSPSC